MRCYDQNMLTRGLEQMAPCLAYRASYRDFRSPRIPRHQSGRRLAPYLATGQRLDRYRDNAVDHAGDVVEIAKPFRQFCQPLAVADGLVCHGEREMQRPIEIDLAAIG